MMNMRFTAGQASCPILFGRKSAAAVRSVLLCLPLLLAGGVFAQYSIDWHTTDGGGNTSTGGIYSVSGTIGQPDAGPVMTGGAFELAGGFWALFAVATPGAPVLEITRDGPNQATLSWTAEPPGWILQETTNLVTSSWSNVPGGSVSPVTVQATAPVMYFRLFKP